MINPKLAHGYLSENQFLPLSEEGPPKLYYKEKSIHIADDFDNFDERYKFYFYEKREGVEASFKSIKIAFGKKQTKCFVKDDLTIGLVWFQEF